MSATKMAFRRDGKRQTQRGMNWHLDKVLERVADPHFSPTGSWYDVECDWVDVTAARLGVKREHFAGVVAAQSVQKAWDVNKKHAVMFVEQGRAPGLSRSNEYSASALSGGHIGRGPKTNAFRLNLLRDWDVLTLDRHMLWAFGCDVEQKLERARYNLHSILMLRWMFLRGIDAPPAIVQAGLWMVVEGMTLAERKAF